MSDTNTTDKTPDDAKGGPGFKRTDQKNTTKNDKEDTKGGSCGCG